jgi:hypothetical protein
MHAYLVRLCAALTALFAFCAFASAFTYQIDDGDGESSASPASDGGALAWMNSFQVEPGGETLVSITFTSGGVVTDPMTVHIWTDPTNDGNPVDAVGARSAATSTEPGTKTVPITPLTLPAGSWFFAGGFYARPTVSPVSAAPLVADLTDPDFANRSYYSIWNNSATADPDHPSVGAAIFAPEPEGNYLVRVNAVPEPSAIALVLLALLGFGALGRMR